MPTPTNPPGDEDVYVLGDVDIVAADDQRRDQGARQSVAPWLLSFLIMGGGAALFWLYVVPMQLELDEKTAAVVRAEADAGTLRGLFERTARDRDTLTAERDRLTADLAQKTSALEEAQRTQDELNKKLEGQAVLSPPCPTVKSSPPSKSKPGGGGKR